MSDPQKLRETNWRRPLTPAEEAELRSSAAPEAPTDLELENDLTEALNGLPNVPVSSNFTARVLQAMELEAAAARRKNRRWSWRFLLPRLAFGATAACAGLLIFHQHTVTERVERARSVATVSEVAPDPAVLKDFDAIRHMSRPSVAPDEELLALLQ